MNGDIKVNRIKSRNKGQLALLSEVVATAQEALPKLRRSAENRVEFRNMEDSMSALGKYVRKNGFDPTRTFQHVASFDNEVWLLILAMFARYDDETGELMDDGLLYKMDQTLGTVKLNRDFFFALLSYLEAQGRPCDMRGKINVH